MRWKHRKDTKPVRIDAAAMEDRELTIVIMPIRIN
jgi:hypothetical protein